MARNDVAGIVSGAGLIASIFTQIADEVKARGGTDEDIHRLTRPDGRQLIVDIADQITGASRDRYTVSVDHNMSLARRIAHWRWYLHVDSRITAESFGLPAEDLHQAGTTTSTVVSACFHRKMTTTDLAEAFQRRHWTPATLDHLLALCVVRRESRLGYPLVALGSTWRDPNGALYVPCLTRDGNDFFLELEWCGEPSDQKTWHEFTNFAAVLQPALV